MWSSKRVLVVILAFWSCDRSDSNEEEVDLEACHEERQEIDAALDALNYCAEDQDCLATGIHPHYGCHAFHHKDADPAPVEARIDAYSTGSCWDGTTTLTMLDCAEVGKLVCKANKCTSAH